ncbi:InlB B-repeat-containing protein [Erwinia sp. V71]|uniref:InlB B-repeat-containing protein n=1 Tax=Erwinia sp. V71 TaxID=3369424 RepID=UPI003F62ACDF
MTELFRYLNQLPDPLYPDARVATINVDALQQALKLPGNGEPAPQLRINLPDALTLDCQTVSVQRFDDRSAAWHGILPNFTDTSAHLGMKFTQDGVRLSGLVIALGNDWLIRPRGPSAGVWIMPSRPGMLTCNDPVVRPAEPEQEYFAAEDDSIPVVIDILALYPPATATPFSGGHDDIVAIMREAETVTNTIFSNSDISARVRIVDIMQVNSLQGSTVSEMLDLVVVHQRAGEQQRWIPGVNWPVVNQLRDTVGADLVVMLSAQIDPLHGVASCIPEPAQFDRSDLSLAVFSISVMPRQGYNASYVFAHELGHLLGGKHDRLTQPGYQNPVVALRPEYDYARGYIPPNRAFVTIMGYPNDETKMYRIPSYSTPDKSWQGQPVGIAIGKPDAADDAHLFRRSTRVVARYRGDHTPRWQPAYLAISIEPALGGFVSPDQPGPYPQGSLATVRAIARPGYVFRHWERDDVLTDGAILTLRMDHDHKLKAVFAAGEGLQPGVRLGPLAQRYQCILHTEPPGPDFTSGSVVYVEVAASAAALQATVPLVWLVEGGVGLLTVPLSHGVTQWLMLEQDFIVDLLPAELSFDVKGQRSLATNATSVITLQAVSGNVLSGLSYPASLPVEIDVAAAPEGTIVVFSETATDADGLVRVNVTTGDEEGDLLLKVGLKDAPERSRVLISLSVTSHLVSDLNEPYMLAITQQQSQQILEGATPAPVVLNVTRGGLPAAAILNVTIVPPAHGITVADAHSQSGEDGRATVVFAPHTQGHYGQATVSVISPDAHAREDAKINILPLYRRFSMMSDNPLQVKKVNDAWPQPYFRFRLVAVREHYPDREESGLNLNSLAIPAPGVPVTYSIDSGSTGMHLTATETMWVGGTEVVTLTAPTAAGTASVTLYSEHCDPATMTIHVTES